MSATCHIVIVQLNSVEMQADSERSPGWAPASVQCKRESEGSGGGLTNKLAHIYWKLYNVKEAVSKV